MVDRFILGFRACREAAALICDQLARPDSRSTAEQAGAYGYAAHVIRALPDPAPAAKPDARMAEIRARLNDCRRERAGDTLARIASGRARRRFNKHAPADIAYLLAKLEDRR